VRDDYVHESVVNYFQFVSHESVLCQTCDLNDEEVVGLCHTDTRALEGFTTMRYINRHFAYLLTYLLTRRTNVFRLSVRSSARSLFC